MENVKAEALSVKSILDKSLSIPDYQRPYKWQTKQVQQLLEDLLFHYKNKQDYRIGTVIVHHQGSSFDIVDGQQRITSLLLILKQLDKSIDSFSSNLVYEHRVSHNNIINNLSFIDSFLSQVSDLDNVHFSEYILNTCQMVYIELKDLDEAFQFFDSQNSRG